jgi:hypothetical protein
MTTTIAPITAPTAEQEATDRVQREAAAWSAVLSDMLDLASSNPERFAALVVAAGALRDELGAAEFRCYLADVIFAGNRLNRDVHQLARTVCEGAALIKARRAAGNAGPGA